MRRSRWMPVIVVLIALGTVSMAKAAPELGIVRPYTEPAKPSVALGGELFAANCSSCHGIGGGGIQQPRPGGGDITGEGPSLKDVGSLAANFYLTTGFMPLSDIRDQPEQGPVEFSPKEVRSLEDYIASLGNGPSILHPDPKAGSLSQGMSLFTLNCAGCHQIDAEGGFVTGARVPPLPGVDATQIAEAVRIGPYEMPRFTGSQISGSQLNSLVKYVLSTRHDDNRGGWSIGNIGPIPEGLVTWWIAVPLLIIACMLVGRRRKVKH
jgi:ubiquinol-cytochrome c reductase cytochrome c subunit